MKNSIFILILLFLITNSFAQTPESFTHQLIVRDNLNNVIANQTMGVRLTLMQGSPSETIVYQETFSSSSNSYGLLSLNVGTGNVVSGDFSAINWSINSPFSLEVAIDTANGSNYTLFHTKQFKSQPYALFSKATGFSNKVSYTNLSNKPFTIAPEQNDKVDLLDVDNALNLDLLSDNISTNNEKNSFPGFDTTAGTAYEILWSQINDSVYYNTGNVGVGISSDLDISGSALHIKGGILYDSIPTQTTPGLLFYDHSKQGEFSFYNQQGEQKTIGRNIAYISNGFTGIYDTQNTPDTPPYVVKTLIGLRTYNDVIIKSNLSLGSDAPTYEHQNTNTMTFSDSTMRIKFYDTSTSSAFPTTDWQMVFNDLEAGGANYFAIKDLNHNSTPFSLMAGSPNNSLFIAENGNIGLETTTPIEKLEIPGTVKASTFNGSASQLTGLIGMATDTIENTGSTTLAADTDKNSIGSILFQTKNSNRLMVSNSGNIGIRKDLPSATLDIDGGVSISGDLSIKNGLNISGQLEHNTINDPESLINYFQLDVSNKSIIKISSPTNLAYLNGGIEGQKITLINTNGSLNIYTGNQIYSGPNNNLIDLPMYGSITMIYTNYKWIVTDIVTSML